MKDYSLPAFPRPYSNFEIGGRDVEFEAQEGMTLRDYFAAKAMQSMFTSNPMTCSANPAVTCGAAYQMADAMLLERAKWAS